MISLSPPARATCSLALRGAALAAIATAAAWAADSKISGIVLSTETGRGVAGATVRVSGAAVSATTDLNGAFTLEGVPTGPQDVSATKEGYRPVDVTGLVVNADGTTRVELPLATTAEPVLKMEAFAVSADVVQNSGLGLLAARQKAIAVSDAIGSDDFSRLAVSNAADAMSKVTGASVVDGKYVLIRGLGDRYANTLLNGAAVPSADPDKRAVQMDQFPADLVEAITTTKSFTPDQPGAFSGGSVDIKTKAFPERFFFSVSLSGEYNTNATGEPLLEAAGGLGSAPAVPADIPSRTLAEISARQGSFGPAEALDAATKAFGGGMYPVSNDARPELGMSLALGNRHGFGREGVVGYTLSFTADRSYAHSTGGEANRFIGTASAPQSRLLLTGDRSLLSFDPADARTAPPFGVTSSTVSDNRGGFVKLAVRPAAEHQISLDVFHNESVDRNVRRGVGEEANNYVGSVFEVYDLLETARSVGSAQLAGKSVFPAWRDLQLEWRASASSSTQDQPDYRTLASVYAPSGAFINATGVQPNRFFRELEEDAHEFGVDFTMPFVAAGREHRVRFGGLASRNERTYTEQRFQYGLNPRTRTELEAFPNPVGIVDRTASSVTLGNTIGRLQDPNNYTGEQEIRAGYAMVDAQAAPALRAIVGVRFETTEMSTVPRAIVGTNPKRGAIDRTEPLPALSLIYASSPKTNLRLAYGRTLARPTYKELTDIRYEDVFTGDTYLGNPGLELTVIDNFDLRWEWFPRRGETLAFSVFHKELKRPIEVLYEPAVGSIQPQNVESGTVSGIEFEFRRSLRFLSNRLTSFSLGANVALIDSAVTIPAAEMAILRAYDPNAQSERELLGQSPYVVNFDLTYDRRQSGTAATLSYNLVGERLDLVNFGPLPDVYEQPAPLLNLVIAQRLTDRWRLRFSAKNLLDPDRRKTIGLSDRSLVYSRFSEGRSFALSLSYLFD